MRCPFTDPEFTLPIDVPCPVCGATGSLEDFVDGVGLSICMDAIVDDDASERPAD